ncbi:MAG: hypothetical protein R3B48_26535 [Kofleriaceae bacterium]
MEDAGREDRSVGRLRLAWALQYEATSEDEELARFLLEQELSARARAAAEGPRESLPLMSGLVARAERTEDAALLARARATCAAAGIEPELAHLPRDLDERDARTWIERALAVGARAEAKELVQRWRDACELGLEELSALAEYLRALGEHQDEAGVRLTLLGVLPDRVSRARELCRIARAERRAGRWARAMEQLEQAGMMHRVRLNWRELELGHELIEESFELARVATEDVARRALSLGDELAEQTSNLPPTIRAIGAQARAR